MKTAVRFALALLVLAAPCASRGQSAVSADRKPPAASRKAAAPATAAQAKAFVEDAETKLLALANEASRASWVQSNFITDDTEILAAVANERVIAASVRYAKEAARFDGVKLSPELARKIQLLKNSLTLAAPSNPKESEELTQIVARLEGAYGKGKYCPPGKDTCLDLEDISKILATSRDPKQIEDVWRGWHTISVPMRKDFARYVELANKGAKELGFADTGAMWRSKYDMPPADFAKELDRLWDQVRPLYVSLHAYVRAKLREKYGDAVPANGPIPAHLLGNMWAQDWSNVYPLVAPKDADPGYDLTAILKQRKTEPIQMVRYGEAFFTSLGFDPLPKSFWERSLFTKPRDRDVVCHASAWDVDNANDLRIKMCIDITAEDFSTIHHELGHNFYQRAYNTQPFLFRDSANDGFHEAIGDTIALSITPEYLVKLGFIEKAPDASKDIGLLLSRALEKLAFLPFGLLIDQWRWKVFSGRSPPSNTTRRGGTFGSSTRASLLRARGRKPSSIRARSTTCPRTSRTRGTSSPTSSSFSSTARSRRRRVARLRCTAARSTGTRPPASGWRRCSRWGRAAPGPTPSRS